MLVAELRGSELVVIGETAQPEPVGSVPRLYTARRQQPPLCWELTWLTDASWPRSRRGILLQPGQDPKLLPGWKPRRSAKA